MNFSNTLGLQIQQLLIYFIRNCSLLSRQKRVIDASGWDANKPVPNFSWVDLDNVNKKLCLSAQHITSSDNNEV